MLTACSAVRRRDEAVTNPGLASMHPRILMVARSREGTGHARAAVTRAEARTSPCTSTSRKHSPALDLCAGPVLLRLLHGKSLPADLAR